MGLVAKAGGYLAKKVATAYVGKGKKWYQKAARYAATVAGRKIAKSIPILGSFKKGGKVKKTGAYLLHKGERVIPSSTCTCSHKSK